MANNEFNPYNFQQYLDLPKGAYQPERVLEGPAVAGFLGAVSQAEYDRVRREAEEAMQRRYYYDSHGGVHGSWQEMIDADASNEIADGRTPCQKGAARQTGNW